MDHTLSQKCSAFMLNTVSKKNQYHNKYIIACPMRCILWVHCLLFIPISVMACALPCYIGPCYNQTSPLVCQESPGHQQQWYWLCEIEMFLSFLKVNHDTMQHFNVKEWYEMQIHIYFSSKHISTRELNFCSTFPRFICQVIQQSVWAICGPLPCCLSLAFLIYWLQGVIEFN